MHGTHFAGSRYGAAVLRGLPLRSEEEGARHLCEAVRLFVSVCQAEDESKIVFSPAFSQRNVEAWKVFKNFASPLEIPAFHSLLPAN